MSKYKQSFKDQVLNDLKESGLNIPEIAIKYKMHPSTVRRWLEELDGRQSPNMKQVLKENKSLKAQVDVLCGLVKRFSIESDIKKKN